MEFWHMFVLVGGPVIIGVTGYLVWEARQHNHRSRDLHQEYLRQRSGV